MSGRANQRMLWLAACGLAVFGWGLYLAGPTSGRPALDCPAEQVRRDASGVAFCSTSLDGGRPLAAGQRLTLGLKIDLNQASVEDLRRVPGVGLSLAKAIVEERERLGRFSTWAELDEVAGVGPSKLEVLQAHTEIR